MASAHLLGIDIGTTGVRAAIFDAGGELLGDASTPCPYDAPSSGWAEVDPERWWAAVTTVLQELGRRPDVSLAAVDAIGVVGQAPTVVLVDDAGAPLGPAVLWLDTRAHAEARALGVHAYYLGPKLRWLADHGDLVGRARWLLQSHAFVAYRLTGNVAVDASTAALHVPLFDLAARAWRPERCADVGLRVEQLPPLRAAHEVLGGVTPEAALAIGGGLRAGTPVVAGGADFAAATLGAGVIDEGEACLMLGTAGNLLVPRGAPGADDRIINAHHIGADRWLSLGGTLSGGAQEWLRHAIARGSGMEDTAVRTVLPPFDRLDEEARRIDAGSDGLLFLPYLQGERTPVWDTEARGAFVGLGLDHGRGHLWRAVLEGIALGFVDCQEVLEQDNVRLRDVIAANGGGKSALFRQILCDALGVPLAYAERTGGTVAGAAIIAGLGVGKVRSPNDARAWRGGLVRHEPSAAAHRHYRALLELRRKTYAGLGPVFAGLAAQRQAR